MTGSRLDLASYDWFALVVEPRREFAVDRLLGDRGFATFTPACQVWRRRVRYAKAKVMIDAPLLPGYVIIGMSARTPGWPVALGLRPVCGVVCCGERPARIALADMRLLIAMHGQGRFTAPAHERWMRTGAEYRVGDRVRVAAGPLEGLETRVVALEGRIARILAPLFGARREIRVSAHDLEAA